MLKGALLAVNAGSSSLKVLFIYEKRKIVFKWEKEFSRVVVKEDEFSREIKVKDSLDAGLVFEWIINYLLEQSYIKSFDDIKKVGYRYAHGGEVFTESTQIDHSDMEKIKTIDSLASTHNPSSRKTVEVGLKYLPDAKHILCFDTSFHSSMPIVAKMYGIDFKYYLKGIHKYGFHGLSYMYVGEKASQMLGKSFSEFSGIICHLGNGSSITAIQNGKSVDTSMGFTPVDGLVMGQRSGSVDPSVVQEIMKVEKVDINRAIEILSEESGFGAISGISSDYRVLRDCIKNKEPGYLNAQRAIDLFQYQIRKCIGSYMAILDRMDAIVFTGGIGGNDTEFVKECIDTQGLKNLGIEMAPNEDFNPNIRIPVFQISTNEEAEIIKILENY